MGGSQWPLGQPRRLLPLHHPGRRPELWHHGRALHRVGRGPCAEGPAVRQNAGSPGGPRPFHHRRALSPPPGGHGGWEGAGCRPQQRGEQPHPLGPSAHHRRAVPLPGLRRTAVGAVDAGAVALPKTARNIGPASAGPIFLCPFLFTICGFSGPAAASAAGPAQSPASGGGCWTPPARTASAAPAYRGPRGGRR